MVNDNIVVNRFSEAYFYKWYGRKKPKIDVEKAMLQHVQREFSIMDKQERIKELENDLIRIETRITESESFEDHECSECGKAHKRLTPGDLSRLLETKRKLSEAIAKERGEWNTRPDTKDGSSELDLLGTELAKLITKPTPTVIEAEFAEIS